MTSARRSILSFWGILGAACGQGAVDVHEANTTEGEAGTQSDTTSLGRGSGSSDAGGDATADGSSGPPGASGGMIDDTGSTGPGADTGGPPSMRRLVLADQTAGVSVWDDAQAIVDDVPPGHSLAGIAGTPLALSRWSDRLIVASDDATVPIAIFDDLRRLSDGAMPDDTLHADAIGGAFGPGWFDATRVRTDAGGDLWIPRFTGIDRLVDAAASGSAFSQTVAFSHPWQQLVDAALDEESGLLFGAQISGAGVVAWDAALAASGFGNEPTFALHEGISPDNLHLEDGRLIVGAFTSPYLLIWNDAATLSAPTPPDAALGEGAGLDERIGDLQVRDGVLVACMPAGHRVLVWTDVAAIDDATPPDFVLTDALEPSRVHLDASGRLWVLDRNGVLVYDDVPTDPTFVVKLQSAALDAVDMLVVE